MDELYMEKCDVNRQELIGRESFGKPFLSVVLPCVEAAETRLLWTLRSYSMQSIDPKWFEIVLIEDGKPSTAIMALAAQPWPFSVRYFNSPRMKNPQLAHKNHARNIGWRWAKGDICFLCDCDCLVNSSFVERAMGLYCQAQGKGQPFALYPMIASLNRKVEEWAGNEEGSWRKALQNLPDSAACSCHSFGGHYQRKEMDNPKLHLLSEHPEGYPILSRRIFSIIGGFDEDFLGWGGNKQEFQQRIIDSGIIKQYLLHGCAVFHQPHGKEAGNQNKASNFTLMKERRNNRKSDPVWKSRVSLLSHEPLPCASPILRQWQKEAIDPAIFANHPMDTRIGRFIQREAMPDFSRKILFIGPWVGEFGWEVCRWQGGIRKLVEEKYKDYYIIVAGDAGHHPFYEYTNEYWAIPAFVHNQNLTRETLRLLPEDKAQKIQAALRGILAKELLKLDAPIEILSPKRFLPKEQFQIKLNASKAAIEEQEYLAQKHGFRQWVCVFPRKRALNAQKNWSEENWNKLMRYIVDAFGYGIVLMGREEDTAMMNKQESWFISTASLQEERRMDVNIAFLNKAIAAIGSESGGPFLSLLCGCPTLVMGGKDYKRRYEEEENFLQTQCCFLAKAAYQHSYEEVAKESKQFLQSLIEKNKQPKAEPESKILPPKNERRSYEEQYRIMQEKFGYEYNKREKKIGNKLVFGQEEREFLEVDRFLSRHRYNHSFRYFVELGVHTGASTWMLSRHMEEKSCILGVDSQAFPGCEYSQKVYDCLREEGFVCHYFSKTTEQAIEDIKSIASQGIDLLHLDANESYELIKKDWCHYFPLVASGGIVLMHDISYAEGIRQFWKELKTSHSVLEISQGRYGMGIIVKK